MDFNQIVLVGTLTADPELGYSEGVPHGKLSLSVHRKEQSPLSITVTVKQRLAEICTQFLREGSKVLVSGSLHRENGHLAVAADRVQILEQK